MAILVDVARKLARVQRIGRVVLRVGAIAGIAEGTGAERYDRAAAVDRVPTTGDAVGAGDIDRQGPVGRGRGIGAASFPFASTNMPDRRIVRPRARNIVGVAALPSKGRVIACAQLARGGARGVGDPLLMDRIP